jgi:HK97 family phage portal protein
VSLLRRIANRSVVERGDNFNPPSMFFGTEGSTWSRTRALQLTTVWACIKIRAETIGALPAQVVEYQGQTRIRKNAPTWLEKPNPETTRFQLFELTSASLDADGNAFWFKERDRLGRVMEVWPASPGRAEVFREKVQGRLGPKRFRFGNEEFGTDEVLHIAGFSLPGRMRGMNPIDQHRHALGLAVAAEEYGEEFFSNGAVMSGVIEHPSDPGPQNARRMQESFARDHSGRRRRHKPGVLFGGAKWTQLTIPNDSAQFLETRKYQRNEICSIFRVPPHKIGDLERATFSNIEHQSIEWATDGVMPSTSRIEAAIYADGDLLERGDHLKINLGGLMRGDTTSRFAAYAIGRQWGWLSADDVRALEDMNPLPDGIGQSYLEPLNMVPAGERPSPASEPVARALLAAGVDRDLIAAATGITLPKEIDA